MKVPKKNIDRFDAGWDAATYHGPSLFKFNEGEKKRTPNDKNHVEYPHVKFLNQKDEKRHQQDFVAIDCSISVYSNR